MFITPTQGLDGVASFLSQPVPGTCTVEMVSIDPEEGLSETAPSDIVEKDSPARVSLDRVPPVSSQSSPLPVVDLKIYALELIPKRVKLTCEMELRVSWR